ncbi:hypothetical protein ARMSODRAFT_976829 [Armillaria solidipes]|uniref:Uncharacterized protein n=1 Tax=Armillaria solidipes TaxID=1076256 RepID=A0A2H3BFC7_9AGAR|nr:hypothetical protein ARMSODRAFT_976829 [Armillaria solidipes]
MAPKEEFEYFNLAGKDPLLTPCLFAINNLRLFIPGSSTVHQHASRRVTNYFPRDASVHNGQLRRQSTPKVNSHFSILDLSGIAEVGIRPIEVRDPKGFSAVQTPRDRLAVVLTKGRVISRTRSRYSPVQLQMSKWKPTLDESRLKGIRTANKEGNTIVAPLFYNAFLLLGK